MTNAVIARAIEQANLTLTTKKTNFTSFLNPIEARQIIQIVSKNILAMGYGGYEFAERSMLCFSIKPVDFVDFPISIIKCEYSQKFKQPTHRDILGSILALGLDRKSIGDIVAIPDSFVVLAELQIAEFIAKNLTKIGKTGVTLEIMPSDYEFFALDNRITKSITCSSLRVDALLAAVYPLSRGEASKYAHQGKVFVNWRTVKATAGIQNGDIITLRGFGRLQIKEIENSRSGNFLIHIIVF